MSISTQTERQSDHPTDHPSDSLTVAGEELADHIREIVHEGNVRHIRIRNGDHTVMEIPVTVGLIGLALAPLLAAVAAAGALLTHCTVEIVRESEPAPDPGAEDAAPATSAEPPIEAHRTHLI